MDACMRDEAYARARKNGHEVMSYIYLHTSSSVTASGLPFTHGVEDLFGYLLGRGSFSERIYKLTKGVHKVEEDTTARSKHCTVLHWKGMLCDIVQCGRYQ